MSKDDSPKGTCYEDAYRRFVDENENSVGGAKLVHGEVDNGSGRRITHAWLEGREEVWDPQSKKIVSVQQYYEWYRPVAHARFTRKEATWAYLSNRHYGPWTEESGKEPT